jgi:hypothetical protein
MFCGRLNGGRLDRVMKVSEQFNADHIRRSEKRIRRGATNISGQEEN